MAFGEALVKSFDSGLSGEALMAAVRAATKIPLNAVRTAGSRLLTKKFDLVLIATLELL